MAVVSLVPGSYNKMVVSGTTWFK